ncbi:retinoblastoma 2 isoform X1 [Pelobates cultripes]|uniref:Retinoblastoma-like protein 2 n=2 Tax=Pelobates cultripes TaxID=61616 RepID=A0AAD1TGF7_PELCU|nr:retinoblastoma 2 isoform X1 [Pelobates cultripes]
MIKEEEEEDGERRQGEEQLRSRYEELCSSLNMDERARGEAWESYGRISQNYTLEGNALHWLACALYVACRQTVPTVGQGMAEGNYVSLTRILTSSQLSLIEFFNKMKKWEDMASLPDEFRERTEKLERNFTVTAVLFQKYAPIFQKIFKNPQEEQPRQHRGRKQRRQPCTVSEVFQFCWVLFIYTKGNFPMISDDLVNSYHLLLCALDLVYGNALQCSNRRELLNTNFTGLPEDFPSKDYKPPSEPPCIIETLCSLHNGLLLEAKGIKEHFWKPYIHKLFEKKILKGKSESLTGFLDPGNFTDSVKAINKAYEAYVLSVGNLDERIFLEDAEEEIGSIGRCLNTVSGTESVERAHLTRNLQQHFDMMKSLRISTPLTGLKYVSDNSPYTTPVSSATYSVSRLFSLISGLKPAPAEKLLQILRSCSRDPTHAISERLREMFDTFCGHTVSEGGENQFCKDIAKKYFRLAEVLYYKVLESIICQEKKRLGDSDLSNILEQDVFHRSLLACCLEITMFAYKPPGNFPQIIMMFDLAPYNFYKVIEVFIKAEDGLCRDMVKHLNHIEEQILDSMAWTHDSPLWEKIRENCEKLPLCEEVMHPQHFEKSCCNSATSSPTPLTPRRVNEIRADAAGLARSIPSSPANVSERYNSPAPGTARRRLFMETDSPTDTASTPQNSPHTPAATESVTTTPVPGQTLVTMATATVTANNGQTVTIPVQGIANENGGITFFPMQVKVSGQPHNVPSTLQPLTAQTLAGPLTSQQIQVTGQVTTPQVPASPNQRNVTSSKLKKTSSFSLFCRRVYHLASVRLRDLCQKLDVSVELRNKIWTCFEYSIVHFPDMMKDRHLDQLLMCAVYIMAKVTKEDASFQNIMKCYRTQPHARSDVYRSVLLERRRRRQSGSSDVNLQTNSPAEHSKDLDSREASPVMRSSSTLPAAQPNSAPPTPTRVPAMSSDMEGEQRGDLVQFYNNIYHDKMKTFALKYSKKSSGEATPLSPYPSMRVLSPRRVQLSHGYPIFISSHGDDTNTASPREKICYYFNLSPAKKLQDINSMVRTGETPTKKRGIVLEEGSESPAKRICQENHTALLKRLRDVANDRGNL